MTNLMSQFEFEAAGIPSTATILRVAQVLQAVKLLLHNQLFSGDFFIGSAQLTSSQSCLHNPCQKVCCGQITFVYKFVWPALCTATMSGQPFWRRWSRDQRRRPTLEASLSSTSIFPTSTLLFLQRYLKPLVLIYILCFVGFLQNHWGRVGAL